VDNGPKLLIIQCENGERNTNLISCSKFLVQSYFKKTSSDLHIVFLIQSARMLKGSLSHTSVVFDGLWFSCYLDTLVSVSAHAPPFSTFFELGEPRSISEILLIQKKKNPSSHSPLLQTLLSNSVRLALAKVNLTTNPFPSQNIKSLIQAWTYLLENEACARAIEERVAFQIYLPPYWRLEAESLCIIGN